MDFGAQLVRTFYCNCKNIEKLCSSEQLQIPSSSQQRNKFKLKFAKSSIKLLPSSEIFIKEQIAKSNYFLLISLLLLLLLTPSIAFPSYTIQQKVSSLHDTDTDSQETLEKMKFALKI
jgi:hypothetical protein